MNCLGTLVVLSATATLEVLGSIPKSSKKCNGFFYEILSSSSEDLCPVNGNRLAPYYMGPKTYRRTVGVHWYTSA